MWVCQMSPDLPPPPLHSKSSSWCSFSTSLMMHKVSVAAPPPPPIHMQQPPTLWFGSFSISTALQKNTLLAVSRVRFHAWSPWCVISHKLTKLHMSYLSRSPNPGWPCHDNQHFSEIHPETYPLPAPSLCVSPSLSLPTVRGAFLYQQLLLKSRSDFRSASEQTPLNSAQNRVTAKVDGDTHTHTQMFVYLYSGFWSIRNSHVLTLAEQL